MVTPRQRKGPRENLENRNRASPLVAYRVTGSHSIRCFPETSVVAHSFLTASVKSMNIDSQSTSTPLKHVLPSTISGLLARAPRVRETGRVAVVPSKPLEPAVLTLHPFDNLSLYTSCVWTVSGTLLDRQKLAESLSLCLARDAYSFICGRWVGGHPDCDGGNGYGIIIEDQWVAIPLVTAELVVEPNEAPFSPKVPKFQPDAFIEATPPFTMPPSSYDPKKKPTKRQPLMTVKLTHVKGTTGNAPIAYVLGVCFSHLLFDGASIFTFAETWGAIYSAMSNETGVWKVPDNLPNPSSFRPVPAPFDGPPPEPANSLLNIRLRSTYEIVRFAIRMGGNHLGLLGNIDRVELMFSFVELEKLKAMASALEAGESGHGKQWISTHDALAGYLFGVCRRVALEAEASGWPRSSSLFKRLVGSIFNLFVKALDSLFGFQQQQPYTATSYVPSRIVTIVDARTRRDPTARPELSPFGPGYFGNCTIPSTSPIVARTATLSLRQLALHSRSSILGAQHAMETATEAMYHMQRQTHGKCLSILVPDALIDDFAIDSWVKMRKGVLDPGFGKVEGFVSIPESPPFEWASIWFPHPEGVRVMISVPKGLGKGVVESVGRDREGWK